MKPLIKGVVRSGSAPIRMVDNTGHIGTLSEIFIELNKYRELSDSEGKAVYFTRSRSERGPDVLLQFRVNAKTGRLMWARCGLYYGQAPSQVVIPRLDVLKGTPVFDMHAYGKHPWTEEADEAEEVEENIFVGWDQDQNLCFGLEEPARWTLECRVGPDFSVCFNADKELGGVIHRRLSRMDRLVIQQASMEIRPLPLANFVGWPRDPTSDAN